VVPVRVGPAQVALGLVVPVAAGRTAVEAVALQTAVVLTVVVVHNPRKGVAGPSLLRDASNAPP